MQSFDINYIPITVCDAIAIEPMCVEKCRLRQIPLISQKYIVEIIIDMEQFLRDLLIGHTGDELYYPLLHGPAGSV